MAAALSGRPGGVSVLGTGSHLPARVMTNAELEKIVETSDEWITSRTGIKERRIAAEGEHCSDLGAAAARKALEQAGVGAHEVDLILGRDGFTGHVFPVHRVRDPELARRAEGGGDGHFRRVLGVPVRDRNGSSHDRGRGDPVRAHHRHGKAQRHGRLDGPQHLRALWRRCRRG